MKCFVYVFIFKFEVGNKGSELKIFSVPDFIGFAARQLGKFSTYL